MCLHVCVCALKAPSETLSEPQPVPLAMIMTTLSRAIERRQKKIVVCFPITLWALRQKKQREKSEIKIWHLSGRGMGEVFYFSLVFSSTSLLLAGYSHSYPEGRAAILVSCPAETISRRIRESKDKLLNMTQKIFITTRGLASQFVYEREKSKQVPDCVKSCGAFVTTITTWCSLLVVTYCILISPVIILLLIILNIVKPQMIGVET